MKTKHFHKAIDQGRVLQAIRDAEEGSTGDIVLLITHKKVEDPLAEANKTFQKLNLNAASDKNSVLILLAPESRKFAFVSGPALHEKVGHAWWNGITSILSQHFKEKRYNEGLLAALEKVGSALKTHFPSSVPLDRSGQQDIMEN